MKLLSEKEIEEAANILCNQRFNLSGKIKYGDIYIQGIISGASFAEQKLLPMMVEFAEWLTKSDYEMLNTEKFKDLWTNYENLTKYTTDQLVEQLIDYKSNQSKDDTQNK